MLEAATLIIFPMLMAFAASTDLFTMTISNRVSLLLLASFMVIAPVAGLPAAAIFSNLSCGAAVLLLSFAFFAFGWIGGGDAKLAAATAVWLGWPEILDYGIIASLLGGVLTIGLLEMRKSPMPSWAMARGWIVRLHDEHTGIPYGIALAAAGLLTYPQTEVWRAVALG